MELCPALGISIPVGKDSLSMRTTWNDDGEAKAVISPVSLIVSAFAPVPTCANADAAAAHGPRRHRLILIDLGRGKNRLGASALAQVTQQLGNETPDVDSAEDLKGLLRRHPATEQRRQTAGLPRPFRRRPVRARCARWPLPAAPACRSTSTS
jgi:phosphoribosylformylglycinamidine (FGAM) synthase-like enzyme